ncbi:ATP-binding protein [Shewanella algae]|uniref:ATP-binding protein n=1 Tax=Shewanella algae TaxID=38313 RepID=UPI0031F4B6E9
MKKIYFISGVHGVGKGTLCRQLKSEIGISFYSCSDLIKQNSDYIEDGKVVTSAERNQVALIRGLSKINEEVFLLDGHFCLIGKEQSVIELDDNVFDAIGPVAVINVVCEPSIIHERLLKRDGKAIGPDMIELLQLKETERAEKYCKANSISLFNYQSPKPIEQLLEIFS